MNDFVLNFIPGLTIFHMIGFFLILILTNFLVIKIWHISNFSLIPYKGEQVIHEKEISPLGGFCIYVWFFFILLFLEKYFFVSGLISYIEICLIAIPMVVVFLIEDIYHDIDIRFRLAVLSLIVIYSIFFWVNDFPLIELPFLDFFFESKIFTIFFFCFCLVGLMNGSNFIDGMNGLAAFYFISAICSCLYLCYCTGLIDYALPLIFLGIGIIGFLVFNYPLGKIFLGDLGAYFISFFIGLWTINFFAINTQISSWNAILIFFYPITEVLYSFIRKTYEGKSPFYPDTKHLHRKIFDIILHITKRHLVSNALTTILLLIF